MELCIMKKQQEFNNAKATKFLNFLEKNEIKAFMVEQVEDDLQSVVFRSRMEIGGQELPMIVLIDNSIYTLVRIQIVASAVKESNSVEISKLLNALNRQYKVFKYYVTEKGDLCLDCCIPSTEENFDGELIRMIIQVILQHLTEEYPNLMRSVWK